MTNKWCATVFFLLYRPKTDGVKNALIRVVPFDASLFSSFGGPQKPSLGGPPEQLKHTIHEDDKHDSINKDRPPERRTKTRKKKVNADGNETEMRQANKKREGQRKRKSNEETTHLSAFLTYRRMFGRRVDNN